ncbi:zinc-dependent metalloproteinase lipoprotein [Porphyromonas sp.]|uniref:zinc-dependent metalloproteinase lipoprotein n=1 Tax=Porphyromonas sp. TaxID=1924944 RepID=UPI0026DB24B0|nr:zinc-dependent metalloproteinase lipoprotein [Porphyromonas sp.]MDO4695124.1 zinc-dependent metalloproteinase lipoprotein [Porphyromonas sp.]MDO4770231.1 zinc-dependent metalloproteinase lipoprotein [Porphyromonas sp.]
MMRRLSIYPILFNLMMVMLFASVSSGCKFESGEKGISLGVETIDAIPVNGGTYKVLVKSSDVWTATPSDSWFRTEKSDKGLTRTLVTIVVEPNISTEKRSGQLVFKIDGGNSKAITLNQVAGDLDLEKIDYKLPVIFHILYTDNTKQEDKPSGEYLATLMEKVNKYYRPVGDPRFGELEDVDKLKYPRDKNDTNRPDMGLEFVMAQSDPSGKPLPIPGINRVKVSDTEINYLDVLRDKKDGKYHALAWDRSKYINIFVFRFKKEAQTDPNTPAGEVHGATFLPALVKGKNLPGFKDFSPKLLEDRNHVIVINTVAFHKEENTERELYNPAATLSHELGHYLGLYHVFAENEDHDRLADKCVDSDYCEDTPSYDRKIYEAKRLQYGNRDRLTQLQLDELLQRTSCEQRRFYSTNIMDYEISHQDIFSVDQRKRIRMALYYSPLVPGVKFFSKEELRVDSDHVEYPPLVVCGGHHNH